MAGTTRLAQGIVPREGSPGESRRAAAGIRWVNATCVDPRIAVRTLVYHLVKFMCDAEVDGYQFRDLNAR